MNWGVYVNYHTIILLVLVTGISNNSISTEYNPVNSRAINRWCNKTLYDRRCQCGCPSLVYDIYTVQCRTKSEPNSTQHYELSASDTKYIVAVWEPATNSCTLKSGKSENRERFLAVSCGHQIKDDTVSLAFRFAVNETTRKQDLRTVSWKCFPIYVENSGRLPITFGAPSCCGTLPESPSLSPRGLTFNEVDMKNATIVCTSLFGTPATYLNLSATSHKGMTVQMLGSESVNFTLPIPLIDWHNVTVTCTVVNYESLEDRKTCGILRINSPRKHFSTSEEPTEHSHVSSSTTPPTEPTSSVNAGLIAGIIVAVLVVIVCIIGVFIYVRRNRSRALRRRPQALDNTTEDIPLNPIPAHPTSSASSNGKGTSACGEHPQAPGNPTEVSLSNLDTARRSSNDTENQETDLNGNHATLGGGEEAS